MAYKQPKTSCQYCPATFNAGGEKQMYKMLAHEDECRARIRAASSAGEDVRAFMAKLKAGDI